jgi:DNA-directed RNA polymerase specialized sigma24 family protein
MESWESNPSAVPPSPERVLSGFFSSETPGSSSTTRWDVIRNLLSPDPTNRRDALVAMCEGYRGRIHAIMRRCAWRMEDPEDLTQGFLRYVIETNQFARADKSRGRFRTFLGIAIRSYLSVERAKERAGCRGGGRRVLSIDAREWSGWPEPSHDRTPERLVDQTWVWTLMERARERLRSEYETRGTLARYVALEEFLDEARAARGGYTEIAQALGMKEGAVRKAVHDMRDRHKVIFRQVVAETLVRPVESDIDDELRDLLRSFEEDQRDRD